jgi:hypothetical protein
MDVIKQQFDKSAESIINTAQDDADHNDHQQNQS